jgi:DNA-binding protein HU-beta
LTRQDIVDAIAKECDLKKKVADQVLTTVIESVTKTLKKGGKVSLVGFGTFTVSKRAARAGRNPRTGETIQIQATKVPKFKAGKELKQTINK